MVELEVVLKSVIILFGGAGFILAHYVWRKKNTTEVFVCPLKGECHDVVRSDYSKFFGVPVEKLGMLYYLIIFASYALLLLFPAVAHPLFLIGLFVATLLAFLFSLYLTAVQGFALRKWCTWCLISASFCTVIFAVGIVLAGMHDLTSILTAYKSYIVFFHALAAALGVGAATLTDIFFFKFLRDREISRVEHSMLGTFSQVIWFALGMLVLTGIGLFLPQATALLGSEKFVLKMALVLILIINGVLLNIVLTPKLTKIAFGGVETEDRKHLVFYRRLAFILGPISIVTWYTVFILGSIRALPIPLAEATLAYLFVLTIVMFGSYLHGESLARKGN